MTVDTWNLVGDIGGTNARFGINRSAKGDHQAIANYKVADYPDFSDVLRHLMEDVTRLGLADGAPSSACFAVAGPPHMEMVSFTNSSWRFTRELIREQTGVKGVHIINDFAAVARALPLLTDTDRVQIGAGQKDQQGPMVALGAGTGLGVGALLLCEHQQPVVVTGEGGHVDFAPVTDVEAAVLQYLRSRYGRVSIERLCCGHGIVNIYQALADYRQKEARFTTAADIGAAAQSETDPLAREAMAMFFAVLGASAGNFALTFGALGGVYIAGGVVPRYVDLLRLSDFRARFLAKGRFADYLSAIPTYVITHQATGLLGAALTLHD